MIKIPTSQLMISLILLLTGWLKCFNDTNQSTIYIYHIISYFLGVYIYNVQLVGGFKPWNFIFHSIYGMPSFPTDELIFFKMVKTTNQINMNYINISIDIIEYLFVF